MNLSNYSALPFYDSKDEQLSRRTYAYGEVYPLYVEKGKVPPFQFVVHSNGNSIQSAVLVNYNDDTSQTITNLSNVFVKMAFSGYDVFVCRGVVLGGVNMTVGRWYLQVNVTGNGTETIYSEVFTAVDDVSPYTRVQWWDDQDLVMKDDRIVYEIASGLYFKNEVYLDCQIGMPDYDFEEEGETRDGLYFPEKMISVKTHKFTFLAPEYLLDAMRFIRMSDNMVVTDRDGRVYTADTFLLTPKWQAPGMLAAVDAEFKTSAVAKKIGRDY